MDKISKTELEILLKADDELFETGRITLKCPRCGNEIIYVKEGSSYSIRCKTENCIEIGFRGI